MGEKQTKPFQLSFNGLLKVDFQGSHVTSDGGLILVRELDERLGLGELIDEHLSDSRQGTNKQFTLADLLRQSVYSRLAGYEDLNDAERVSIDPTFRLIGSQKIWDRGAALTSTLHGFETEMLASEENLLGADGAEPESWSGKRRRSTTPSGSFWTWTPPRVRSMANRKAVPTTDTSSRSATIRCFCSTVMVIASLQSCVQATCTAPTTGMSYCCRRSSANRLRASRSPSGAMRPLPSRRFMRLREERGVQYAIRIPANKSLELEIEDILFRPPGRPSAKPLVRYKSFRYQAASWSKPRRIVAKVEHHPGELFAQPGFIVTNMTRPSRSVVRFYNKRGTAEQWIKEGKQATNWTRLSCHRFRANEVRLQLSVLAYNLGNLWRRLDCHQASRAGR